MSLDDPMTNLKTDSSDIHVGLPMAVGYRNDLSTDQIFYVEEPPSYDSIRLVQTRSRKRLGIIVITLVLFILIVIVLAVVLAMALRDGIPCDKTAAIGMSEIEMKFTRKFLCYSIGKSCTKSASASSVTLLRLSGGTSTSSNFAFYSFEYIGQSNSDVITFAFDEGWDWYLDDISIVDTSTDTELIDNGDFETGSLNTYCVCSGRLMTGNNPFQGHSSLYTYESSSLVDRSKLSQSLDTIPGRKYNVSFCLNNPIIQTSSLTVSMSTANQNSLPLILIFSLLVFYILSIK